MRDAGAHSGAATDVVLALSLETWDDLVRREFARPPDRMAQHLRVDPRVHNLVIANPWRSLASVARRRLSRTHDAVFPVNDQQSLVRPLRIRRADSTSIGEVSRSYHRYSGIVRRQARRRGLRSPVLITFSPIVAGFGDHTGFRSVTYVARDDWAAAARHSAHKHIYLEAYERIRRRGIRVSAVSEVLMRRLAPTAEHIVTPNGVDATTWSVLPARPAELDGLPEPLVVYTGTIDDRLCGPSLISITQAVPQGTLVFVGPRDSAVEARIRATVPGCRFFGPMGQSALAAFVGAADVCVVPHVRNGLTEAMSPLKMYEYVAAGKPVVATNLEPMRGISSSIILVDQPSEFGVAVTDALAGPPAAEATRAAFIADNAWATRCRRILDLAMA